MGLALARAVLALTLHNLIVRRLLKMLISQLLTSASKSAELLQLFFGRVVKEAKAQRQILSTEFGGQGRERI
jgi:hypothetical protein